LLEGPAKLTEFLSVKDSSNVAEREEQVDLGSADDFIVAAPP